MGEGDPSQAAPRPARPELFHAITDAGSAEARRLVVELGLEGAVRLRNVNYPEVEHDLRARGGGLTPALWSEGRLIVGGVEVAAALEALATGRASAPPALVAPSGAAGPTVALPAASRVGYAAPLMDTRPPSPLQPPAPAEPPQAAEASTNRLLGGVLLALVVLAGVVVASELRGRDQAPAPTTIVGGDGRPFRLDPYLEELVRTERASAARFDALVANYRSGAASEAAFSSSVAREVIAPYATARSHLKNLPSLLPEPINARIARVLAYVDLRGELWLTESRRLTQPGIGNRPLLTDEDTQRLASARAASELDQVVLPPETHP